jgi:hypothetical protein
MNQLLITKDLPALAQDIFKNHTLAQQSAESAIQYAIKAGAGLVEAKALCKHGEWLTWLKENNFPERTAQNYMKLSLNTKTVSDLGIREALDLLSEPREIKNLKPIDDYYTDKLRKPMQLWPDIFYGHVALLSALKKTPDKIAELTGYSVDMVKRAISPSIERLSHGLDNNEADRLFTEACYKMATYDINRWLMLSNQKAQWFAEAMQTEGYDVDEKLINKLKNITEHYDSLSDTRDCAELLGRIDTYFDQLLMMRISIVLTRDTFGIEPIEWRVGWFIEGEEAGKLSDSLLEIDAANDDRKESLFKSGDYKELMKSARSIRGV